MVADRNRWLLGALLILSVGGFGYAILAGREQQRLRQAYARAEQLVQQLSDERAHLASELAGARETVEDQAGTLANLQEELTDLQARLEATLVEIGALQREHEQARAQNNSLAAQRDALQSEKQRLEAKLSSLTELRLAIREVKRRIWHEHVAAWRAWVEAHRQADQEQLASGNRGYVVREGQSTLSTSPTKKLHVRVLELQPQ